MLQVADREITDSHPRGWEQRDVAGILQVSSNVGAALIGRTLGARRFDQWVRRFGFGTPTGVDLPGEESGIVLDYADYSGSTAGNMAMGQGLAVTPLQMAAGYSAIANGGILRPPHIVDAVGGRSSRSPEGHRVISEKTPSQCAACSRASSAPAARRPAQRSTATSWPARPARRRSRTRTAATRRTSSWRRSSASRPRSKPRLLVAVMVDEPKGDIYGGTVAGPAFKDITSFALTNLRIAPG